MIDALVSLWIWNKGFCNQSMYVALFLFPRFVKKYIWITNGINLDLFHTALNWTPFAIDTRNTFNVSQTTDLIYAFITNNVAPLFKYLI